MIISEKVLAAACVEAWGHEKQLDMVLEELSELSLAIHHLKRGRDNGLANVMEETADVEFMLTQLKVILHELYEEQDDPVGTAEQHIELVVKSMKMNRTQAKLKDRHPKVYEKYNASQ